MKNENQINLLALFPKNSLNSLSIKDFDDVCAGIGAGGDKAEVEGVDRLFELSPRPHGSPILIDSPVSG